MPPTDDYMLLRTRRIVSYSYLVEPRFKPKKSRKKKPLPVDGKSSLGIIDEEELEHLQSDVDEEEEEKEGSIAGDLEDDDDDVGVEGISAEPLYVLPLYAILSSDKQARVCRSSSTAVITEVLLPFRYSSLHHLALVYAW